MNLKLIFCCLILQIVCAHLTQIVDRSAQTTTPGEWVILGNMHYGLLFIQSSSRNKLAAQLQMQGPGYNLEVLTDVRQTYINGGIVFQFNRGIQTYKAIVDIGRKIMLGTFTQNGVSYPFYALKK